MTDDETGDEQKARPQSSGSSDTIGLDDYLDHFKQGKKHRALALEKALEIRKFEIELYWKRATYFWAFIAATFIGFAAAALSDESDWLIAQVLALLGYLFSVAWYLANRASKYWQENWEAHVDALEDAVYGPLYKLVLEPLDSKSTATDRFFKQRYSVSGINSLLSIYVSIVWIALFAHSALEATHCFACDARSSLLKTGVLVCMAAYGTIFLFFCRTNLDPKEHRFRERKVD